MINTLEIIRGKPKKGKHSNRGRGALRLDKSEQNELMLKISKADSFEEVEAQFTRLYDSLIHPLWSNLSTKFSPPLSSEDLKDIFQEAWIKLLEQRTKYNGKSDVFNWIYTIKKNLIIDKLRKMKRYQYTSIDEQNDDDDRIDFDFETTELSIEDKIAEEEKTELLRNTLNNIQDDTIKELLMRRIVQDQKLELIAKETGIPLTTVYKKIQRGLKLIKPEVVNILTS